MVGVRNKLVPSNSYSRRSRRKTPKTKTTTRRRFNVTDTLAQLRAWVEGAVTRDTGRATTVTAVALLAATAIGVIVLAVVAGRGLL